MKKTLKIDDFCEVEIPKNWQSTKTSDWKWDMGKDYPKITDNSLKVFSCFSCGGGSTMGYKLAGCNVLGNCEIDPKMNEIYVKNHNPKYNFLMDIRDFNSLSKEKIPHELFDLDILDGSPPCTPFSTSGLRDKVWGKTKKFREGQSEQILDELPFVFQDTVQKLRPKVCIMENVEGLTQGKAFEYVKRIHQKFSDIGYTSKHFLLKAENMGVPQKRHRVFFIAIRKDRRFNIQALNTDFYYKRIPFKEVKSPQGRPLKKGSQVEGLVNKAIPYEDNDLMSVLKREENRLSCFSDKIVWDDNVCPTITTSSTFLRGDDRCAFSNEDIISVSAFPQDYDFNGLSPQYICGMSVPPLITKRIVERLIENGVFKN